MGAYRPERVVMNSELVDKIDSSDEWIRERTGIVSRHFAAPDESVIDMAEHASRAALAKAGISADQIGFVLVATVTHPYQTPAAAPELAARLGSTAPALDISAACAGYCYGVTMASDMIKGGSADYVLV
ncbi:MAG: 3-oxoacyl-ACP synthase, partial [Humibacillus sp.]